MYSLYGNYCCTAEQTLMFEVAEDFFRLLAH